MIPNERGANWQNVFYHRDSGCLMNGDGVGAGRDMQGDGAGVGPGDWGSGWGSGPYEMGDGNGNGDIADTPLIVVFEELNDRQ